MIKRLKPRDFRRTNNDRALGAHYVTEDGEHIIEVPLHVSTRTLLHEIGHMNLGHDPSKPITFEGLFGQEVDAEIYAYQHMDKPLNYKVLLPAIYCLADYKLLATTCIFELALEKLAQLNITIDRYQRSKIWWEIRKTNT